MTNDMFAFFAVTVAIALLAAFALSPRQWSLWHTGMHTEYAGPGRVWFISFFHGSGYVVWLHHGRGGDGKPLDAPGWRPNIYIPGFTLYVRTAKSRHVTRYGSTNVGPVRLFRITRNANTPVV